MKLQMKQWKHICFLLSLIIPGTLTLEALSVAAVEITNTAVFAGDNIQNINTNTVFFSADITDLQITKTADRAAAEPGDTVIYRVSIRNVERSPANNPILTDTLPLGLNFSTSSVKASLTSNNTTTEVPVSVTLGANRTVAINYAGSIPGEGILDVTYAVTVTPDGVRGTGRNVAVANAGNTQSNTASHLLRIRPGILSNCATLIGRVFVDKNFDGEQQRGEPGIPNAVIYMDDGNRILTDANGMYSLANVISGRRTGTLDLTSLPGYTLAPNLYDLKKNSPSRLVRLAPGGMGRMNFAVTPTFGEGRE